MTVRPTLAALAVAVSINLPVQASTDVTPRAVLENYAAIAEAGYQDSLTTARTLLERVNTLIASPTGANLDAARQAWRAARVPYMQTEVFRFGNPIVDDWEGKVNAWPLDEGLIDYVATDSYGSESDENPLYTANVIANPTLMVDGEQLDASVIDKALLRHLHEADQVEANVATGYHAIEFLLWGQDLNGTRPGAGERPASDYDTAHCTGGHCDRRGQYLKVATELLVDDLQEMTDDWGAKGEARKQLFARSDADGLAAMLTGMGSLSFGELAGDRTKLGLMLHDPEESHDCFSDNTDKSHYYDALGIRNIYYGHYRRIDGSEVKGPSLASLIEAAKPKLDKQLRTRFDATQQAAQAMVDAAARGQTFDVLIGADNPSGNRLVQTFVDDLVAQSRSISQAVQVVGSSAISIPGSDSLDNSASQ